MRTHLLGRLKLSLVTVLALSAACTPSMIPGTQIADTKESRELLKQVELYRQAVERKDAAAVLDMVSESYYDTRGHPDDPAFHWDYNRLKVELPERLALVKNLRLEIVPRRVEVKKDRAQVSYLFTQDFLAELPTGEVAKHESDLNRMEFQRINKRWLITRGL
jgi:hypothetical protein